MITYYDYERGRHRIKRRYVWGVTGFIGGLLLGGYTAAHLVMLAVH